MALGMIVGRIADSASPSIETSSASFPPTLTLQDWGQWRSDPFISPLRASGYRATAHDRDPNVQ